MLTKEDVQELDANPSMSWLWQTELADAFSEKDLNNFCALLENGADISEPVISICLQYPNPNDFNIRWLIKLAIEDDFIHPCFPPATAFLSALEIFLIRKNQETQFSPKRLRKGL